MEPVLVPLTDLGDMQVIVVEKLLTEAFPHDPPDLIQVELARARDRPLGRGYAMCLPGRPLAAVLARTVEPDRLFVVYLAVDPGYRRQGLARALLAELVERSGITEVEMLVDHDNHVAQRLYAGGGLKSADDRAPRRQEVWRGSWRARPRDGPSHQIVDSRHR